MMARVLIVDDHELNLELASEVLEMEGLEVETASRGKEGIAKALASPPDIILMDLRMPGMSGLEAMQKLRRHAATRRLPIVVLTASAMKGDRERLLREGFDAYLEKPINVATFAAEVLALLKDKNKG